MRLRLVCTLFSAFLLSACSDTKVLPGTLEKAQELCAPHDGVDFMRVSDASSERLNVVNTVSVACNNDVVINFTIKRKIEKPIKTI